MQRVKQQQLALLKETQEWAQQLRAELEAQIEAGAEVEPGALEWDGEQQQPRSASPQPSSRQG